MENLDKLTIPDEFTAHYFDQLKTDLEAQNIQLSKVGFAGFLFNLFGNVQFDIKTYYEHLFKEAFPITALDDKNLGYHSDVFGYVPALGEFSKLVGILELNMEALPIMLGNVSKREIYFKDIQLTIDDIIYTLVAEYKIVLRAVGSNVIGHVEIITDSGKQKVIPFQIADPSFPIFDFNQYVLETTSFVSTDYIFGTSYSHTIAIGEDDYVTQIDVTIDGESYNTSRNKSFTGPDEKVVFYEITPDNNLIVELGSGINGKYVPGSSVSVTVYKTQGALGNIGIQETSSFEGNIHIFNYDDTGAVISQLVNPVSVSSVLSANIERAIGGKNPLKGKELRTELIKYIQSRDSLNSETDYRYILDDYFDDYEVIFKKLKVAENIFYVYQFFKDRYNNPVYTTSASVLEDEFNTTSIDNSVYYPEFELAGEAFISPFLYIYDPLLNVYNGHIVKKQPIFYSTGTINIDPSDFDVPPLIFLQLEYNVNTTTIYIKSYQDITDYKFTLNIPTLDISNIILINSIEENTLEYNYTGIISEIADITIDVYDILDIHKFSILFEEVQQVVDISDVLMLKTYTKKDLLKYIVNLSLIHKDTFFADEEYYLDKIIAILSTIDVDQNRLISDEIQIRLLNTYNVDANYLRRTTLQEHNISDIEVSEVTLRADVDGDLSGTYFEMNSIDNQFYIWFNIPGLNSSDPRPDLDNDISAKKEEVRIDIEENFTANEIRTVLMETLNAFKDGAIFLAYDDKNCDDFDQSDGIVRIETLDGGTIKEIRDPDPLSNNPNRPTGFTFGIIKPGIDIGLKLPFTLNVNLSVDKQTILTNNISLTTELEDVKLELATFLFENKTKIYQKFYSSEIIEILHHRDWVKSAKVILTDVDGKTIEDSNIEILPYTTIESNMDKEELLDYTPILYYFDINNINIEYRVQ
jgi:hypothetical protein